MIIRNGVLYLVARLVPGILGVATTSILTRLLTPASYGIYGLALIVMSLGSTIAFEWLGLSFMRFYETGQDDTRTIPTFVSLYLGMVVLTGGLMAVAMLCGLVPGEEVGLFAVGLCMAYAFAFFELVARFEVAAFRPVRYLILNSGRAVLLLLFTLGGAVLTRDPLDTAIGTCLGLCAAVLPAGGKHLLARRGLFNPKLARQVLWFGAPFAVSMLLAGLFNSGVRGLVAMLAGTPELGLYTVAAALSQNVLSVVASAIGSATYPSAVRAWEAGDPVALRAQLAENFALVLGAMVPASLGIALVSGDLANQLVAPAYRAGVATLTPWMALTLLLVGLRGVYLDQAFQLGKNLKQQVIVSATATILALLGTFGLVPVLGVVGAPIATSGAALLSCGHAIYAGRYAQRMPIPLSVVAQVGCALAVMTLVVVAIPSNTPSSLYAKVAGGASAYAVSCVALNLLGLRPKVLATLATVGKFSKRYAKQRG